MWGERISGGRGEAKRVGRRDCSMRRAIARKNEVISWTPSNEMLEETYSCPASRSARQVEHDQIRHEVVRVCDGMGLSSRRRFQETHPG